MLIQFARTALHSLSGRIAIGLLLMLLSGLSLCVLYLFHTTDELRRTLAYVEAHRLLKHHEQDSDFSQLPLKRDNDMIRYTLYSDSGESLWHSSNIERPRAFRPWVLATKWHFPLLKRSGDFLDVPVSLRNGNIMMVSINDKYSRKLLEPLIQERIKRMLWLLIPLSICLSFILVPLLLMWTLTSIKHASAAAQAIQPSDSKRRIPTNNLPLEIRPLADAANQALARLAKAYQTERRFVADTAHGLRTPLTVLDLQLDNLVQSLAQPSQYTPQLAVITQEMNQLKQLVNQLLQLARLENNGDQPAEQQNIKLSRVMRQVAASLLPYFEEQGRELQVEIAPNMESHQCGAASYHLHEVFSNLVENALIHGSGNVAMRLQGEEDSLHITIADQGQSLVKIDSDTLCTRFYKARSDSPGSGLGLSIVKKILRNLGGNLALVGQPNTQMVVTLPKTN